MIFDGIHYDSQVDYANRFNADWRPDRARDQRVIGTKIGKVGKEKRTRVVGMDEMRGFSAKLDSLESVLGTSYAENPQVVAILEDAARPVIDKMRARVTVLARKSTGNLSKSLKYKISGGVGFTKLSFGWAAIDVARATRRAKRDLKPRYTSEYGPILEFSDSRQLRHLYPTFEECAEEAAEQIRKRVQDLIDKALG